MTGIQRQSFSLTPEEAYALRLGAERTNVTMTEFVRRSIKAYEILQREVSQGGKVFVLRSNGEKVEVML